MTAFAIARRTLLKGAAGALTAGALPAIGAFAAERVGVTALSGKLTLLTGAGGNVLVLATSEGLVVVDSGAAEHGAALLETLREISSGRVHTLLNTHWHLDQVGSNEAIGRAGAAIVAHEKTRLRLATDYYLPLEDRYQAALPAAAHPTQSFYTAGAATIGGEAVEYGYLLEAHTDGDIYVDFRGENVVAVGDVVSPVLDPVLDWFGGGWLGGRVDALALLLGLGDEATRFVPSYGAPVARAEVQAEHDVMLALFERMVELVRKGMSAEDIVAAGALEGLGRSFADPLRLAHDAHKGMWAHHNKLMPDIV